MNGRPIKTLNQQVPTYAYLICDITPNLKADVLSSDAQAMPDGLGFYGFNRNFGVYYEVLEYGKVLEDAKKRNRILFERLKLV